MINEQPNSAASVRGLQSLDRLPDFKVAEGDPDIRGWHVATTDSKDIGKVTDLLVDTNALKVRYLCVELDSKFVRDGGDRRSVLIPVGVAQLDDKDDLVFLNGMTASQLATLPMTDGRNFDRQYEENIARSFGAQRFGDYTDEIYDDRRIREGRESETRKVIRSEEELAVGKKPIQQGEVKVSKHVDTERVRESVPVTREEVTIEHRPASGRADARIEGDEIRVPVMAEEVVAEKRVVPKEEVVIKKQQVQGEQAVEADVRKERIDVRKEGTVDRVRDDRLDAR